METITITKEEFDKILEVIEEYNANDDTYCGGEWEYKNALYLEIARKGVDILRKYGRTPFNKFEEN